MKLNKKVILTGATGGIGKEITKLLYCRGATVLVSGKNKDALQLLTKNIIEDHITIDQYYEKTLNRCII